MEANKLPLEICANPYYTENISDARCKFECLFLILNSTTLCLAELSSDQETKVTIINSREA